MSRKPVIIPKVPDIPKTPEISIKSSSSNKWIPFIFAGAAVGISILAIKQMKNLKKELLAVKKEQLMNNENVELQQKINQLETNIHKMNQQILNQKPKSNIIRNVVPPQIPPDIKIINEPDTEENIEYEEVEVTDSDQDN